MRGAVEGITESSRADLDRRATALGQARRIAEHLPVLKARAEELKAELKELRELIADEEAALRDLRYEGTHTRAEAAARHGD